MDFLLRCGHLIRPNIFSINLDLKDGNYYTGEPDCSGNCIVKRSDFMGYDENIKGYGGEDTDLYISLTRKGIQKNYIGRNEIHPTFGF